MALCFICGGSGSQTCPVCNGRKGMYRPIRDGGLEFTPCANCGGRGHARCRTCQGTGQVPDPVPPPPPPPPPLTDPPSAVHPLAGRWAIQGGEWLIEPLSPPLYKVTETSALGSVQGLAMPGSEGQHPPSDTPYAANSPVIVTLKNPMVGDLIYSLTFDGAHTLHGSGQIKALGMNVGNIVVTRIG